MTDRARPLLGSLAASRYWVLGGTLVAATASQARNGIWSEDMWLHVAVVKEMATNPWAPQNPLVLASTTHPYYSPYALALALVSRVGGIAPTTVLAVAGVGNVAFLIWALRAFVREVTGNEKAAFWALLFSVLLWGWDPWRWSGFITLNALTFVAPYPSMFALGLTFAVLAAATRWTTTGRAAFLWLVALGVPVVILIHALTAVALMIGLVAIGISRLRRDARRWGLFALAVSGGTALSLAWPYVSVLDTIRAGAVFDVVAESMFQGLAPRLALVIPGAVAVAARARRSWRDPLFLMFAGAITVYALAALTDHATLGRLLAFAVPVANIALGDAVARLEHRSALWTPRPGRSVAPGFGVVALCALGLAGSFVGVVHAVPAPLVPARWAAEFVPADRRFASLRDTVGQYDVVATHKAASKVLPAVSGKVVSPGWPTPFIDNDARAEALRVMMDPATTASQRAVIRDRYDVHFVLTGFDDGKPEPLQAVLREEGATVAFQDPELVLFDVHPPERR